MTRSTWTKALSADMNVTPMLDVLLVLLVIFMAALQARKTIDAQLSVPCTGACRGDGASIVLEVLPGPTYRLNSQPVPARELLARLTAVYSGRPDKIIQVAGSPAVRYQEVVAAMDLARTAGVRVIGLPPR